MGLVVFAAPTIERYHLHERLERELRQEGHRVHTLCTDAVAHTFWLAQGGEASWLRPRGPDAARAPLDEIAVRECRRLGLPAGSRGHDRHLQRVAARLSRLLPAARAWLDERRPDLLVLHGERRAEHHLLQFAAREAGIRVVWTGDGLLPHTLQVDERGLDGDAAAASRRARDYRVVSADGPLLDACLASTLAGLLPVALSHRAVVPPPPLTLLRDAGRELLAGGVTAAITALAAWRSALPRGPREAPTPQLPRQPFVALLLQDVDDVRVRLDAPAPVPNGALIAATAAAVGRLDKGFRLLVVAPPRGLRRRELHELGSEAQPVFAPHSAAAHAAATALCTVTVNHPFGSVALLANTPVVHVGRALWGLPGVSVEAAPDDLHDALTNALGNDRRALRRRFLSWLFGYGHVWCSATAPDHNGITGLLQAVAQRLPSADRSPRRYRTGPAWPLAAVRSS